MSAQPSPSPMALTPAQAAKVLSAAAGRKIGEELIREDLAAGAPANADGTINILHYAAWLAREAGRGD